MKRHSFIILLALSLALCACGRSKPSQFYILNPTPPKALSKRAYADLKIGIDTIHTPAFAEKPQLLIHDGINHVQLMEFHRWAESLDKNIKRVIRTNLNTLLPNAIVEDSPWNIEFKPNYILQVDISELYIDRLGNSNLRADYIIFYQDQLIKKYERSYHLKITAVNPDSLVKSMNSNLNHLTYDIAKTFTHLR